MSRLLLFAKARGLFAHQRILVFWLVALVALAAPWLWLSLADHEPAVNVVGHSVAVQRRE